MTTPPARLVPHRRRDPRALRGAKPAAGPAGGAASARAGTTDTTRSGAPATTAIAPPTHTAPPPPTPSRFGSTGLAAAAASPGRLERTVLGRTSTLPGPGTRPAIWERVFVGVAFYFLTFGLPDAMFRTAADKTEEVSADPNLLNTLTSTLIYLVALSLLVLRSWWIREGVRRDGLVVALVSLAVASTLWSVDPSTTLRRSVALALSTVFAYYVASRFTLSSILRTLLVVLSIGIFASIAWSLGRPAYGVDLEGQWVGITTHKNELARSAVLTIVTALFVTSTLRWRLPGLVVGGAALFTMIMTRGTTAVVTLIALTGLLPIWGAFRARRTMLGTVLVTLTAASVAAAWAVTTSFADMIQLTGKDVTLTGRTELWAAVLHHIGDHPLLGHGYEAFWRGWDSRSGEVWLQVGWRTPHSHNGVLEALLGLGAVGGIILVAMLVRGLSRSVNYVRNRPGPIAFFPVTLIAFVVLYSATEKGVVVQHSIHWVLLVIVLLTVGGSEGRLLRQGQDRRDRLVSEATHRRGAALPTAPGPTS